jgi:heme exporter protein A
VSLWRVCLLSNRLCGCLDEPFTAIDHAGVQALETWLIEHAQQGGMVLLTTHHVFNPEFPLRRLDLARYRAVEMR